MADDINVGSVSVDVVPDARRFPKELAAKIEPMAKRLGDRVGRLVSDRIAPGIRKGMAEGFAGSETSAKRQGGKSGESFGGSFAREAKARIRAALASLPDAKIGVATSRADQELKDLQVRLAAIGDKTIGVDISAADAQAEMAFLEAELLRLGSMSPNIQVQVDTARAGAELAAFRGSVSALSAGKELPQMAGRFSSMASSLGAAVSSSGALVAAMAAMAVALIPVVASVAGLAAALAAPLAAAGGGLTIFGLLAGKAIGKTNKIGKQIDELKKKASTLVDPKAAQSAREQAKALEDSLTGPQKAFLKAKEGLSGAFDKLLGGKSGDALFAPIVAGMNLLSKILPGVTPLIQAVSKSLTGMLDTLARKASGSGFASFMQSFATMAGTTLTALGKIAGNVGVALGNIFGGFAPAGKGFLDSITRISAKFAEWSAKASTQRGIQNFMDYVKANGPVVARVAGQIVLAVVQWAQIMAPVGAKMLRIFSSILGFFNKFSFLMAGTLAVVGPIFQRLGQGFAMVGRIFRAVYNATIGPVFSFILRGVGMVMNTWASMLRALGHVPGFKWAKSAAQAMGAAADQALGLASKVRQIPSGKKIAITAQTSAAAAALDGIRTKIQDIHGKTIAIHVRGEGGKTTAYASGTNSARRGVALVGEDGPEMVRFGGGEQVVPTHELAAMLRSSPRPAALPASQGSGSKTVQPLVLDGAVVGYLHQVAGEAAELVVAADAAHSGQLDRMDR